MSTILEHPTAQALLAHADVSAADVRACRHRLHDFLARYLPLFYHAEQRQRAEVVVQGKLSNLHRKTSEPIAYLADRPRKPMHNFVGAGAWDDDAVLAELRRQVAQDWGSDEAVLVVDGSGFPNKGTASCGVQRQWCGRLGKVGNCQVGVLLAYVTRHDAALVDRQLYLPREWARSRKRRKATHVPKEVRFRQSWRIALDVIDRARVELPFGRVSGDDEFGRVCAFRAALRQRQLRYVLDVPCDTLVRDLDEPVPAGKRCPPWQRVDAWARALPPACWRKVVRGDGAKGPKVVRVAEALVQTKAAGGRVGGLERLVVVRSVDGEPQTWYALSNASARVERERVAGVQGQRHGVEEALETAKGEMGLGQYEVRSWVGWHHRMTLSMLALWFLALEKQRLGKKTPGIDGAAVAGGVRAAAATEASQPGANRGGGQSRLTA